MTQINQFASLDRVGAVAVITLDNPPVNALSAGLRTGLMEAFKQAKADPANKAIVLICAGRTFIAGADISEFGKPPQGPGLNDLFGAIEGGSIPVVAAIHGTALGGGLEVALACHYRVAVPSARFGLPEVKLGLLPGAGGTQRLPRLVGIEKAMAMITTGDMIGAKEALETGLIEEIVPGDLKAGAIAFAEKMAAKGGPYPLVRDRNDKMIAARANPGVFDEFRKTNGRRWRGQMAPNHIMKCLEAAVNLPFDAGIAEERRLFTELVNSDQSKAQRYFFFAEREAAKVPGLSPDAKPVEVKSAAIIGAGTMGGGITMNFANAGIPVTLIEQDQKALDRGLGVIRRNYENTAARGGLTPDDIEKRMALITPSLKLEDVANADLIIEAVYENMGLKKEIFQKLDKFAKKGAILGTNTSALNIDEIAAVTSRPESVIGLHFFSPANVMRLLEIVRAAKTADWVVATSMAVARKINKVAALVGVCDGFVGNRIMRARGMQSERLLVEGALPQQIDKVLTDFGFPMGPYAVTDMGGGIELGWRRRQELGTKNFIGDSLAEKGRFGQKAGKGFYHYEPGSRAPLPDPEVEEIIKEASRREGVTRRAIPDQEIFERLVYPMINEAAKILDEGMALRASDIDVIWVYGYGWPLWRGGPMFYADLTGLKKIRDRMLELQKLHGDVFKPAPLMEKLVAEGKGFADFKGKAA
ncbi:MAG TPA: 3-hydroxyacyl-CoA dehydrogenase NAD-binding domain-containing protein [Stellaceae bacterium]|nr:3-hydroxyacyl-CoA dehydrogenase NAD-binding domain-containing protein [Stellaceae bacterium]